MAYQTGAATDQNDLMNKLYTFLTANGWTGDEYTAGTGSGGHMAVHKSTVYVSFKWDEVAGLSGDIGLYQALGFTPGNLPGTHPNDSGNGDVTGALDAERRLNGIGNGAFPSYFFFASGNYCHVVLEFATGLYRHMSFGIIEKVGAWTGGEYAGAHYWSPGGAPGHNYHSFLLDGQSAQDGRVCATMHAEGLPNEGGSSKWGFFYAGTGSLNDRAGNPMIKFLGFSRHGILGRQLQGFRVNPANGFVPMWPVHVFYWDATPNPDDWYYMGKMPDVRILNIFHIEPKEEITIGSDVWKVFPWVRKLNTGSGEESRYYGVAYKKIV